MVNPTLTVDRPERPGAIPRYRNCERGTAMGRHDRLIAFLEHEAKVLRDRIAGLRQRDIASGVSTGEGDDTRLQAMREETEGKLEEIEAHLAELRLAEKLPQG
jgi:hypothetical protein